MNFFQDIGRKITNAGQRTIQKTKDISDITRLNSMVSEEERKIENNYSQIGRLYASLYGPEHDPNFAGPLNAIDESRKRIQELKNQIQMIQGVQKCPKCGTLLPQNAAFCSSCGTTIPKAPQQDASAGFQICPRCGTRIKRSMNFCTSCGNPMRQEPAQNMYKTADTPFLAQNKAPESKPVQPEPWNTDSYPTIQEPLHHQPDAGNQEPFYNEQPAQPLNYENGETDALTVPETPQEQKRVCPNCGEQLENKDVFCTNCGIKIE